MLEFIKNIDQNFKRKLFRREVEASFYSNKKFNLPRLNYLKDNEISEFRNSYPFSFFGSKNDLENVKCALGDLENLNDVISCGQSVLNNNCFIYGKEISLGEKINWSKDPISGHQWPKELVWKLDFMDIPAGADPQNIWEVSDFHSAIYLGKAYIASSDKVYAEKFKQLVRDFTFENPFCATINWVSSPETAKRTINLILGFSFFVYSEAVDEKFINEFNDIILQHAVFLEHNLEYKRRRGTGYLLNLLALGLAGILLNRHYFGKKLAAFSFNNFESEIRIQVHEDGVSTEQSIPYHTLALEIFYLAKIYFERTGRRFSDGYNELLGKKFNVHYNYLREDNSVPQLGDSISSRIVSFNLTDIKLNYSFPMSVGAMLFNEGAYKSFSTGGTAELLFLFGKDYVEKYANIKSVPYFHQSKGFIKGGHYIMRTPLVQLFIEAGEIGNKGEGAPGHNDILTFELYYKNLPFIIDPGSSSFYADKELRNKMRSVRYHNSVSVDNQLLTDFDGVFKIKEDITMPKVLEWKSDNEEDTLSIQHYAYTRFSDPVICKRTFRYLKYKNIIKIKDELLGGAEHSAGANIIFHPYVELVQLADNIFRASVGNERIEIKFSSPSDHFFTSIQSTDYSFRYGRLDKTNKITIHLKEKFPAFFITEIILL